jgi:hypothetical protein
MVKDTCLVAAVMLETLEDLLLEILVRIRELTTFYFTRDTYKMQ